MTDVPLDVGIEDCVMGTGDPDEVRRLFLSLEFRSLLDRLQEATGALKPKVEVAELDLRRTTVEEVAELLAEGTVGRPAARGGRARIVGVAVSAGGAQAAYAPAGGARRRSPPARRPVDPEMDPRCQGDGAGGRG